jgi:NCAIR mutase (PurE)-related protein
MSEHRLDFDRRRRLGMVEAVWGEHKSVDQLIAIAQQFEAAAELLLVTRISATKADAMREQLPQLEYHPLARCLSLGMPATGVGPAAVALLTAGSSDAPVAAEAALALQCHGISHQLISDVGVAGLHRLLTVLPQLEPARVLIVCAGMEGSLATVLAGLVPQPVIAVPVSVGYGVSAGGRAALEGMLASCAPGLTVVNIDNGYGAAMAALRILRGA